MRIVSKTSRIVRLKKDEKRTDLAEYLPGSRVGPCDMENLTDAERSFLLNAFTAREVLDGAWTKIVYEPESIDFRGESIAKSDADRIISENPADPADYQLRADVERDGKFWRVVTTCEGLDRPEVHTVALRSKGVAQRFAKAVMDGVALQIRGVARDIDGDSYLSTRCLILGRTANADLRELGY